MPIHLISDLHLESARPDITRIFMNYLKNSAKLAEALYILGDLFEVWIGDDDLTDFNVSIIQALKEAGKALPIYILPGNRDFLLGKRFFKQSGCTLLPDEYVADLYGRPTLLMH